MCCAHVSVSFGTRNENPKASEFSYVNAFFPNAFSRQEGLRLFPELSFSFGLATDAMYLVCYIGLSAVTRQFSLGRFWPLQQMLAPSAPFPHATRHELRKKELKGKLRPLPGAVCASQLVAAAPVNRNLKVRHSTPSTLNHRQGSSTLSSASRASSSARLPTAGVGDQRKRRRNV